MAIEIPNILLAQAQVSGIGLVAPLGFVSQRGFSNFTRTGVGLYTLATDFSVTDNDPVNIGKNVIVMTSLVTSSAGVGFFGLIRTQFAMTPSPQNLSSANIAVKGATQAGVATDIDFYIQVWGFPTNT